jgi:hypothetical protein
VKYVGPQAIFRFAVDRQTSGIGLSVGVEESLMEAVPE